MSRTIAIEHGGKTYSGQLAAIKGTRFGWEDHGILTVSITCEWHGGGISPGGYVLDRSLGRDGNYEREGTAYGLDHVMQIMRTVGVERWEALPGSQVIVLFDAKPGTSTLGTASVGIAGLLNDKVLIFAEHAQAWQDREQVSA